MNALLLGHPRVNRGVEFGEDGVDTAVREFLGGGLVQWRHRLAVAAPVITHRVIDYREWRVNGDSLYLMINDT